MKADKNRDEGLYLGVDVGGTKVQASVVRESGAIVERERWPTPPHRRARTSSRRDRNGHGRGLEKGESRAGRSHGHRHRGPRRRRSRYGPHRRHPDT